MSRQSLEPASARRPDFLLRMVSISAGVRFSASMIASTAAASMSPQRVPITMPASGVRPIEVSTTPPFLIAASEEPLPRWQVTRLTLETGFLRNFAAAWVMNLCEVPWKPYLRIPIFL